MPIRPATWSDLTPAAHCAASAFFDEELFGPIMHPHRHTYPGDMYLFFLRRLRREFFDPACLILVSYPSSSRSAITGVAVWEWRGARAAALREQQSVWGRLAGWVMKWWTRVESKLWKNRAADPSRVDILARAHPFIDHYWATEERKDCFDLALCGVSTAAQGQGHGRELVRWGVEKAREEGVVAGLVAAKGKEGFYRKCGFGEPVGWASEGEENPIKDVPGGAIMFTVLEMKERRLSEDFAA